MRITEIINTSCGQKADTVCVTADILYRVRQGKLSRDNLQSFKTPQVPMTPPVYTLWLLALKTGCVSEVCTALSELTLWSSEKTLGLEKRKTRTSPLT